MNVVRKIAVFAAATATALAGACASGTSESEPREGSGPEFGVSQACLREQGRTAWILQDRIQNLTLQVLRSPDRQLSGTAAPLRRSLAMVERQVQKVCGDGRTPLVPLIELAYRRGDDVIDAVLLRELVTAFGEWTSDVGQPRAGQIVFQAHPCAAIRASVTATYVVRQQPESGGTKAWVVLTVRNGWSQTIYVDHAGTIRATGVSPHGGERKYEWGGSSADTAGARPGRSESVAIWPAGLPDRYVHLLPGGSIRISHTYGSAYGTVGPCGIPVTPG